MENTPRHKFIEELSKQAPGANRFTEAIKKASHDNDYKIMTDHLNEYFDQRDLDDIIDTIKDDYDAAMIKAASSAAASSINNGCTSAKDVTSSGHAHQHIPQYSGAINGIKGIADMGISSDYYINRAPVSADDIELDGMTLRDAIKGMQERLAILDDPDPEKLEKFAALKKAYENYKIIERLCYEQGDDEK